jgi:hypothetical protein
MYPQLVWSFSVFWRCSLEGSSVLLGSLLSLLFLLFAFYFIYEIARQGWGSPDILPPTMPSRSSTTVY